MSNDPHLSDMVPVQEEDYDEGTVDIYGVLLGADASQERGYNDDHYDDHYDDQMDTAVIPSLSHSYHNDDNDASLYDDPFPEQPLYHAPGQVKRERDHIITEIVETEMKYLKSLKGNAQFSTLFLNSSYE